MQLFAIFLYLFSLFLVSGSAISAFNLFKTFFQKIYKSREEEVYRESIFNVSLQWVKKLNLENPKMRFGINQFSDMSDEEWVNLFPIRENPPIEGQGEGYKIVKVPLDQKKTAPLPSAFDWRDKIGKWPVQHQGKSCSSCWAFTAISAVEAQYSIHNRTKTSLHLSEQEIIDCANNFVDDRFESEGCDAGWDTDGYKYMNMYGVVEEKFYPYTGEFHETCKRGKVQKEKSPPRYKIGGYNQMSFNQSDETIMKLLVENGPLGANIFGLHRKFRNYGGGILRDLFPWQRNTNHAVLIVGYGHDISEKTDYWIIRNSWGEEWGENGYARIERGYNQMGINVFVAFVWL